MRTPHHILVVEDDLLLAEMLVEHLRSTVGGNVAQLSSAARTREWIEQHEPAVVLLDIGLPDGDGLQLLRELRGHCDCPVVVMTGRPTLGRAVSALRLGAEDLFTKPFELQRLTAVVRSALHRRLEQLRLRNRHARLESLVRKVLQDRRMLQQRVDLVCRDLVGAYRDLAVRFNEEVSP